MSRPHTPAILRMLPRIEIDDDGCWIWPGAYNKSNYGMVYGDEGRAEHTHRISYLHFCGPIPDGLQVEHACHTRDKSCPGGNCKHRLCFNPQHLELLTPLENGLRSSNPKFAPLRTNRCGRDHDLLDPANVYVQYREDGSVKRRTCRVCMAITREARKAAA